MRLIARLPRAPRPRAALPGLPPWPGGAPDRAPWRGGDGGAVAEGRDAHAGARPRKRWGGGACGARSLAAQGSRNSLKRWGARAVREAWLRKSVTGGAHNVCHDRSPAARPSSQSGGAITARKRSPAPLRGEASEAHRGRPFCGAHVARFLSEGSFARVAFFGGLPERSLSQLVCPLKWPIPYHCFNGDRVVALLSGLGGFEVVMNRFSALE